MITEFPDCIGFVHRTRIRRWRSVDREEQEKQYDDHHKYHCTFSLLWVDVFGMIIHVDFTDDGSDHDRSIFSDRMIIHDQDHYFNDGEHFIRDEEFQGSGQFVSTLKIDQGLGYKYRGMVNRDIRKQVIINEWVIEVIKNRFCIIMGRCSLDEYLCLMLFKACAMLETGRWRQTVTC